MRSLLTRRIFRQIIHNEFHDTARCWSFCPQSCLRAPHAVRIPNTTTRSLFGFSRKPKRQPKPVDYDPGFETMLELNNRLQMGARTQPPEDLAKAFLEFFQSKQRQNQPLEDTQAQHALTTFEHLRKTAAEGEGAVLTSDEIRLALNMLRLMSKEHKARNKLAKALFRELQKRREKGMEESESVIGQDQDISPFIQVLALSGDALYARELLEHYWEDCLKNVRAPLWSTILRGLILENKGDEVEKTVNIMQKYNVLFDSKIHRAVTTYFAHRKENMEMTKKWYKHPIAFGKAPSAHTDFFVLKLCIKKNELEWGENIFKDILKRSQEDMKSWTIVLQWAAVKGKSVDEIERMMQVMVNRSEKHLSPDMGIFNGLIELANAKNDPYTAERYLALSQKWGLKPNASTYLLQLDYRLKVGDLGGARTAYAYLQGEEVPDMEDLPLINRLIVALCVEQKQDYDAIMGLAEDLSERKARFEPDTVATLSRIHLERGELDDLVDLLNTHAFHFGLHQRASIQDVLLKYCLELSTPTSRAWDTYNVLRQTFTETDIPTRTRLMNSFFARGRSDMATHVFGHMRQQQIKYLRPTVETYAQCLSGLSRAGDLESLRLVHNMIKLDSEIEPNTQLYNALMLGYSGCGEPRLALGFWEDIVHSREGPSYASIQIALRACERAPFGEDTARDIWAKLRRFEIEVTREIYAAYVGALAGQNLFDECTELINHAEKEVGCQPDALLLGTFYNATPGPGNRMKVKEWAWKAYPAAYEALLKLGQYTIVKLDEDGEEQEFAPKDTLFNIGSIGRDAEA